MDKIFAVIAYTFRQHIRHRLYLALFIFGLILIGGGLVVSSLAVDERLRMLVDLGMAGIEFIALFSIVFVTVNLILEEVESKSIYLLLSHPIERWQYVLGRYAGTYFSILIGMGFMAALHVGILLLYGWHWQNFYAIAWLCAAGKMAVVSSLALFISLITTSTASSMTLTAFLWIMGHFTSELKFLAEKSASAAVKSFVSFFYFVTPDFSLFNYRDMYAAAVPLGSSWLLWVGFYTLSYTGTMLFLSSWVFSHREV